METRLMIGGTLKDSKGSSETVVNPRASQIIVECTRASIDQVDAAAFAARSGFAYRSPRPSAERAATLLRIAEQLQSSSEEFSALDALNCGKPRNCASEDELPVIVDTCQYLAGISQCMGGAAAGKYVEGHTSMTRRDPVGVIAQIAPWNYPR